MRIELTPQAAGRPYGAREIRGYALLGLAAGAVLLGAGALLAILDSARLINAGALGLIGIGTVVLAVAYLWRLRKAGEVVYLKAPYAFEITETTFEFPGTLDQEPESWLRSATQVRIETSFNQDRLHLENPELGRRVFQERVLAEPPAAAVDHILGRQREAPRRGAPE